jgi:hypothetical protein
MSKQPSNPRVRRYREELRARGLRPVQIWVPDTRSPIFKAQARKQAERVNAADDLDGTMEWLEDVSLFDEPDEARETR